MAKFTIDLSQPLNTYSPYSRSSAISYTKSRSMYVPNHRLNGSTIHHHGDIIEVESYDAGYLASITSQIDEIKTYTPPAEPEPEVEPFSPLVFDGLQVWQKADGTLWQDSVRTTPATDENDPIGSWDDESGNGNHAIQTTSAYRPLLKLNVQNDLPMLKWDGTNDWLAADPVAQYLSGDGKPFTLVLVTKMSSSSGKPWFVGSSTSDAPYHEIYINAGGLSTDRENEDGSEYDYFETGSNPTGAHVIILTFDGDTVELFLDDESLGTHAMDVNPLTMDLYTLGATRTIYISSFFAHYMGEHILYNRVLTTSEIDQLSTYLMSRWAIS